MRGVSHVSASCPGRRCTACFSLHREQQRHTQETQTIGIHVRTHPMDMVVVAVVVVVAGALALGMAMDMTSALTMTIKHYLKNNQHTQTKITK